MTRTDPRPDRDNRLPPAGEQLPRTRDRAALGQFFTPAPIALFMASLFPKESPVRPFHLLDAGAGKGALTAAFFAIMRHQAAFRQGEVTLFECDGSVLGALKDTLAQALEGLSVESHVCHQDFIEAASELVRQGKRLYSHAILNPPYRKITSSSRHRTLLRTAGIETVNLYSGFVALALALMKSHGHLVAIMPRSFCNGPYYRSFRKHLLANAALHAIHIFKARNRAFSEDNVLQENVILHLERDGVQGRVRISRSTDGTFSDCCAEDYPFSAIVDAAGAGQFISIPIDGQAGFLPGARHSLADLGIAVSTGPVVDFRLRDFLHDMPHAGDVPLLYPGHFHGNGLLWPRQGFRKCNAITPCEATRKWLYPNGWYVAVRRLSSKEERRRIVAAIVDPGLFAAFPLLGFENHLNVFHGGRKGLAEGMARGLACYLNSTNVDAVFRSFNGHTQVNATDLRALLYPSADMLAELGAWSRQHPSCSQEELDSAVENLLR